jgi:hypothetical protein
MQYPVFTGKTVTFDSDADFEAYLKDPAYGSTAQPYIHFGRFGLL